MRKPFVNAQNAFRPDSPYRNVIGKIRQDRVCPFCSKHLAQYHKKPIIKIGRHWILTDNMYPYPGAKHHLLLVHKKHMENLSTITPAAWRELHTLAAYIVKKRKIKGAALVMRFGGTSYTGASVSHLHANIIAGPGAAKKHDPIMFRVG